MRFAQQEKLFFGLSDKKKNNNFISSFGVVL